MTPRWEANDLAHPQHTNRGASLALRTYPERMGLERPAPERPLHSAAVTIAIIGIDPGGRDAGVILRSTATLLYAATVHRATVDRVQFADELLETIDEARRHVPDGAILAAIAVEDVNEPTGFDNEGERHPISLEPILTTAVLLGAVLGYSYDPLLNFLVVPPGGNGSGPLGAYPPELVGPTERHGRYGKRRHLRSAWDVAGGAAMILRARGRVPAQ